MPGITYRTVDQADYQAGLRAGQADSTAGRYRPQDHNGQPADFRQGYVDGWSEAQGIFTK